jgi:hypothetical protein
MYQLPTVFDFQRNLDMLIHTGERQARTDAGRILSEFAGRGMGSSTSVISTAIGCFDGIHKDITEHAMILMSEFVSAELPFETLIETARGRLSNFAGMLLATVPVAGFPQQAQQFCTQMPPYFNSAQKVL